MLPEIAPHQIPTAFRTAPGEQRAKLSSKSETAKAIDYSLKRWTALTRFLADGRLCISNNAAERALRGIAVGRHNWTFAGSDEGGQRAAAIYTLIENREAQQHRPAGLARRRPGSVARSSHEADRRPAALELAPPEHHR
jgi:transposase